MIILTEAEIAEMCQWNPELNQPGCCCERKVRIKEWHDTCYDWAGCANKATQVVGVKKQWLLCDRCAALPRFRKYEKKPLVGGKNTP